MNLSAQIPLQNKHNLLYWGIAVSLGFCMAISGYLWAFQTPLFARREYAFALLLWFLLIPLVYVLLTRFLHPRLLRYSPKARHNWILLSAGVGILFALVTHPPQAILLLPVHHLQINLPGGSADRAVTLEYAKTSLRDIGFGEFLQKGDWQRTKTGFTHTGGEPASLTWSGRSGETATLVFSNSPGIAEVQTGWDGNLAALNPAESPGAPVIAFFRFPESWISTLFSNLMVILTAGFLFLVLTIFLAGVQIKPAPVLQSKKGFWLLYALPMIAVWGIYLLTFFPAVMTPDSIRQWGQVISGQFNDALPVVHTLLVILLTRLWFSPAVVIVFQIIALALTVAWGIHLLEDQGLPRWAGWGLALVFALSPVNGNMVVSLWKDIPYSICLLLLSLMILKAVFSKGTWLGERFSWLWLILVGLGISLFRLNGLPVPILSLIVLAIVYRNQWKRVLLSVGVIAGIVAANSGTDLYSSKGGSQRRLQTAGFHPSHRCAHRHRRPAHASRIRTGIRNTASGSMELRLLYQYPHLDPASLLRAAFHRKSCRYSEVVRRSGCERAGGGNPASGMRQFARVGGAQPLYAQPGKNRSCNCFLDRAK